MGAGSGSAMRTERAAAGAEEEALAESSAEISCMNRNIRFATFSAFRPLPFRASVRHSASCRRRQRAHGPEQPLGDSLWESATAWRFEEGGEQRAPREMRFRGVST